MNARLHLLVIVFTALAIAGAEKDFFNKSFDVKPGGCLEMHVDRGSITIKTSNSDQVDISVTRHLKGGSAEAAKSAYSEHKINISQDDHCVRIETVRPKLLKSINSKARNMEVTYVVSVPSRFNLDLHTSGGNIDVSELQGEVKLHTSGGNIRTKEIDGAVTARTSGGNIEIAKANFKADLLTSGGDIRFGELEGDLTARTTGGNIRLGKVDGATNATTTGGNITIESAQGAVIARTTGGNIKAHLGKVSGKSALRTSGGEIRVNFGPSASADVTARANGGSIRSDFDGDFNNQRTRFSGQLNGGGPEVTIETTGGSITLKD